MPRFVKPLLMSAAGLAVMGAVVAQSPAPPPAAPVPPPPPVPAVAPYYAVGEDSAVWLAQSAPRGEVRPAIAQGGYGGGMAYRVLGDDPRTRDLARKLAEAKDDDDREKLRGELKGLLNKAFEDRLKTQERQVEDLERQLRRLKETISKRKEAKSAIVADRLAALEKDAKGLGW